MTAVRASDNFTKPPLVSVITVVFNGRSVLEGTILSVLNQNWPQIEFIIIDGGSNDGTVEIIQKYAKRLAYWISEPDQGLYDAMNKGLAAAGGDYVWFMNAGDRIYAENLLEKIMSMAEGSVELPAVLYGDTMVVNEEYEEIGLRRLRPPKQLNWRSFRKGMLVCHQAIIVRRDLAEPYDQRYRHSADFDWVIKALKKAGRQEYSSHAILNTGLVLCAFLDGGHSKQHISPSLQERFHIMLRHYGLLTTLFWHAVIPFRFLWFYIKNKRF